jgi:hypothetical protein
MKTFVYSCLFVIFLTLIFGVRPVFSQEFTSSSFKVLDPVMAPSGYSTSANFQLWSTISEVALGTSTSALYGIGAGFLRYPFASSPVVSATAGDGQVALSWTDSTGYLGWTASGYNIAQSTTAGGPYSYTSLGNVTSATQTGLSNGTAYYFVVVVKDAFGNAIASSTEVSSTPASAGGGGGGGSGGGGGGGGGPQISTGVVIKGRAYPGATITVFKDGTTISTPIADDGGNWQVSNAVTGGIYTFSAYAIDTDGRRSLTTSFTVDVPAGQIITISDLIIAPTIGADKSEVKSGNDIKFFGFGYPKSDVNIVVNSDVTIADKTKSDKFGFWSYILNSKPLDLGSHTSKSQVVAPDNIISPFSESLAFTVGTKDTAFGKIIGSPGTVGNCNKNGDINNDKKVNIIDFSILLYFWNQKNPKNPCSDINKDSTVNIFDFSIMLFWWTG